jgi:hypothetical protein
MKDPSFNRSRRARNFHSHSGRGIPPNKNAGARRGRETEWPKFPPNAFRKPDRARVAAPPAAAALRNFLRPFLGEPPRRSFRSRARAAAPPASRSRKQSPPKKQNVKFAPENSSPSVPTPFSAIPRLRPARASARRRAKRGEPSVCNAKRARQTKRCTFNRLRDVSGHGRFATPARGPPDPR